MIGRLNHVGIAVPDIAAAAALYAGTLGADVSVPMDLPEHGVTVAFVSLPNSLVELMMPLGPASPLAAFLAKTPAGGMHHLCFEVADLAAACEALRLSGARVLGTPRPGAHGLPVVFLHPKDFAGTLIELEEHRPL